MTGRQRGNTLLGLVIGALIGLGIALAVAVYITKMPVPFTNKAVPSQFEIDEAETLKNKDWNPNTPLAGRSPARQAPSASGEIVPLVTPSSEVAPPSAAVNPPDKAVAEPVQQPAAQPAVKTASALPLAPPRAPAVPAEKANPIEADPLGDLARSVSRPAVVALPAVPAVALPAAPAVPLRPRPADPLGDLTRSVARPAAVALPAVPAVALPAVPAAPLRPRPADPLGDLASSRSRSAVAVPPAPPAPDDSDPFNYFVQAGAFRTPEDAEKQRIRLQALGLQPRVSEREQAGRTVFRVRVGPFDKKDEADQMTNRLNGQAIDTALVRVQR